MNLTRTLLLYVLMTMSGGLLAAESGADAAAAINRAGELRMLSQRIVKSYAQIGMSVQPEVDRMILSESVRRFYANLAWLADSPVVAAAELRPLQERWHEFSSLFHTKPELRRAVVLDQTAEAILESAETLTQKLQGSAAPDAKNMVNLAGRQRMLSQRLAKAYMLRAWGSAAPELTTEMDTAARDFKTALVALRGYSGNSADIGAEINELSLQWEWLEAAIATEGTGSYRLIVAESSEAILASADRLTALYERLASAK